MNTNLLKLLELVADNVLSPRVAEQYLQLKDQSSTLSVDSTGSNKTTVAEGKLTHEDEFIRDEEGDIIGRNVHKVTKDEKVSQFGYVSEDAAKQDLEEWLGLESRARIEFDSLADYVITNKGHTYSTFDSKALELGATKFKPTYVIPNGVRVKLLNKIGTHCLITDGNFEVVIHEDGIIKL